MATPILQMTKLKATLLFVLFLSYRETESEKVNLKATKTICDTARCRKAAQDILNKMNKSVDPCVNFYDFSCGGFMKRQIPEESDYVSITSDMEDVVNEQIKSILGRNDSKGPAAAKRLLTEFMDMCENSDLDYNMIYLEKDLETLGGFPVLQSDWNESSFDVSNLIGYMTKYGFGKNKLITVEQEVDLKTGNERFLTIKFPSLPIDEHELLNHLQYRNNSEVEEYLTEMVETVNTFGADASISRCEMIDVLELLLSLASIKLSPSVKSSDYKKMTVRDLSTYGNKINWTKIMNHLYGPGKWTEDDTVVVESPELLLYGLDKLFNKFTNRILANYLLWSFMSDALEYFADFMYMTTNETREACREELKGPLEIALISVYAANYLRKGATSGVTSIAKNVKRSVNERLRNLTWMSEDTKKHALKKLRHMRYIVGYPSEILNENAMNKYLSTVTLSDNLYETKKLLNEAMFQLLASRLKKPVDRFDWLNYRSHVLTSTAHYYVQINMAVIPAGYILEEYYDENIPLFIGYGLYGSAFGHEIMHAFGILGGRYDYAGDLNNWWSNTSMNHFNERKQCIIDQYSNYTINELPVNGRTMAAENICDTGGIDPAYMAYLEVEDCDEELEKLRNYSKRQLFWISAAQNECGKYSLEEQMEQTEGAKYAIGKLRINGMVSNQREFASDFHCPVSSPMNPSKKCKFL